MPAAAAVRAPKRRNAQQSKHLTITTTLTIDGSGQSVTLDGGGTQQDILVQSGANLTLNALTIEEGVTDNTAAASTTRMVQ